MTADIFQLERWSIVIMTQKTRVPPRPITNIYCLLFSCIDEEERVFYSQVTAAAGLGCLVFHYDIKEIDIDWC